MTIFQTQEIPGLNFLYATSARTVETNALDAFLTLKKKLYGSQTHLSQVMEFFFLIVFLFMVTKEFRLQNYKTILIVNTWNLKMKFPGLEE